MDGLSLLAKCILELLGWQDVIVHRIALSCMNLLPLIVNDKGKDVGMFCPVTHTGNILEEVPA